MRLPKLVIHADWSLHPAKRIMVMAERINGRYHLHPPHTVPNISTWLPTLKAHITDPAEAIFIGVDFPIGLSKTYADLAGISDFRAWLPLTAESPWAQFYEVAQRPDQIGIKRPFYPQRPGGTNQKQLLDAFQLTHINQLRRQCDFAHTNRRAAAPLFWTMGAQQVGKAAIVGWRDFILPHLAQLSLWPFDGLLFDELEQDGAIVLAETYPAEVYDWLGIRFPPKSGKRDQSARQGNSATLLNAIKALEIVLTPKAQAEIEAGFSNEDAFDACVGVLGMLQILLGKRPLYEPTAPTIRTIEGWILGQQA